MFGTLKRGKTGRKRENGRVTPCIALWLSRFHRFDQKQLPKVLSRLFTPREGIPVPLVLGCFPLVLVSNSRKYRIFPDILDRKVSLHGAITGVLRKGEKQ